MTQASPPSAPVNGTPARPYIGGQAVLEGVMMRAPKSFAIVVRRRDQSLHVREREVVDARKGFAKLPLVRGVASLVESLRLGSEALKFSADQMEKDMEAEDAEQKRTAPKPRAGLGILSALGYALFLLTSSDESGPQASPQATPHAAPAKPKGRGMGLMLAVVLIFFVALPQGAATGINKLFGLGLELQSPAFQAITGVMKLMIVIGYLLLIRRVGEIRRVFQYHGAEHKTISTYEANEDLTVANARAKTTLHPRCGTTFLVMVALMSILVFTGVGSFLPRIETGNGLLDNVVFFAEKLPFLPLIAAFTFELQRVFARYCTVGPLRALLWPGFLVQKITTIEPDDDQLEVALASLRATLFREEGKVSERTDDVRFESYEALIEAETLRPLKAA